MSDVVMPVLAFFVWTVAVFAIGWFSKSYDVLRRRECYNRDHQVRDKMEEQGYECYRGTFKRRVER